METSLKRNPFLHPINQALEKVAGPVLWVDASGQIVHSNEALVKLTGFSEKQLQSLTLHQLDPKLDNSSFQQRWAALRKKQVVSWETEFVNATGKKFPVMMNALLVEMEHISLAFIQVDSQAVFTSRDEFLGSCLAEHRIAACEWDLVADTFYASDFFFEIFHLKKEQTISKANFTNLLKPYLAGAQLESLKTAMGEFQGNPFDFEKEITLFHRNGTQRKLLLNFRVMRKNELPLMLRGYLREVTTENPSHAEALAHKLMGLSQQMVFWINPDLTIRFANPAAMRALNLTVNDLANGLEWLDINVLSSQQDWQEMFQEITTGGSRTLYLRLKGKNERILLAECTFSFVDVHSYGIVHVSASETSRHHQVEETLDLAILEKVGLTIGMENGKQVQGREIKTIQDNIVALDSNYKEMLHNLKKVAKASLPVLIMGELGYGQKILVRTIHQLSDRSNFPMVRIDCAGMTPQQLEKELFGDEKSIFEITTAETIGRIEAAEGGTLVLEGICALSPSLQGRLLRLLQEGIFERLGSKKLRAANVRVVAVATEDLESMVGKGTFCPRLFSEFQKGFVYNFLPQQTTVKDLNKRVRQQYPDTSTFSKPSINTLLNHSHGEVNPIVSLEEKQRQHILEALKLAKGKVSGKNGAAELLGMNPQTLFSKMRKLGIKQLELSEK